MSNLKQTATIIAIGFILLIIKQSNREKCTLEPSAEEGRYWVLVVNPEKLEAQVNPDIFAYWLARDNGFKLLHMYQESPYVYIVDFRPFFLEGIPELLLSLIHI